MTTYQYAPDNSEGVRKKIRFFSFLAILLFICLGMRVWYLQIIKGLYFRELSENNRVRVVSLPGYRGTIKDRMGEILVSVRPSFNLYLTPEDVADPPAVLSFLKKKIEFDHDAIYRSIRKAQPFNSVLIKADISREEVAFVEENKLNLTGVHLKVEPIRRYMHEQLAAQTIGYLGEISKSKLEQLNDPSYKQGDMIGKDGLEKIYEDSLRGQKGYKNVEVDVSGRELRILKQLPPKTGNHLVLTLDARIQQTVEKMLTGTEEAPMAGAVVVMRVQTGEIIAMVSKPSFDANMFAAGITRGAWQSLILDKSHPLQNKAIDGQYPPGSTYKIVTAYAGLMENAIAPETNIHCPGSFHLGNGLYRCWKKGGHGNMDVRRAIVQSCDVFFYTVGNRVGIDKLARYAKEFGLGSFTGINLIGEKPGLIPSSQWKLMSKGQPWLLGETISSSIGQGYNLVTPLQQAVMMSVVANGGTVYRPYLVKQIEDSEGKTLQKFAPETVRQSRLDRKAMDLIRGALLGVVNEPGGTGGRARLKDIPVSGKTGTAQVIGMKKGDEEVKEIDIPYQYRDHAWFVSFAPFDNPEIAVAVIVEHGGHGGATAAPIAKEVIQTYFTHYPLRENEAATPTG